MTTQIYVLTWSQDENGSVVRFNGPFDNIPEACNWGRDWQARNDDSPCWQTLQDPIKIYPPRCYIRNL